MKLIGINSCLTILIVAVVLTGCDENKISSQYNKSKVEDCILPQNPYNEGSGHYAGFNWARETGGTSGNSVSFNEGCDEYYRQLNAYNECIANSRK